jgi:hypothetical protein
MEINNIFEEEFIRIAEEKTSLTLSEVLKISVLDDSNECINLAHIPTLFFLDSDKDGLFTLEDFVNLSFIYAEKGEVFKKYEFRSQLQAHFTLRMWKQVCSKEGEQIFENWIKVMLLATQKNMDESEGDINPDPEKYVDHNTMRVLYEILNVKLTHGIDFQSFFDLLYLVSENMGLVKGNPEQLEDYLHIDVLDIFCKNFIRGFSKLIVDLGFDNVLYDEIDNL